MSAICGAYGGLKKESYIMTAKVIYAGNYLSNYNSSLILNSNVIRYISNPYINKYINEKEIVLSSKIVVDDYFNYSSNSINFKVESESKKDVIHDFNIYKNVINEMVNYYENKRLDKLKFALEQSGKQYEKTIKEINLAKDVITKNNMFDVISEQDNPIKKAIGIKKYIILGLTIGFVFSSLLIIYIRRKDLI